ncbi:hypothetical protein TorRG33x02_275970 [Trema orientale]|uniref:Uncharacterized protein n=1 Tax=Trema orientale TaxID=63057 RepID=A0A2P5CRA4_TREOI|nr:hypothetical protein TorRG33x02_275970 [Trema orientale]
MDKSSGSEDEYSPEDSLEGLVSLFGDTSGGLNAAKEEGHAVGVGGSLMLWKDVCALVEDMGLKLVSAADKTENQNTARKKGKNQGITQSVVQYQLR